MVYWVPVVYLRVYQSLISSLFSMVLVTWLAAQMLERVRRLRTRGYKNKRETRQAVQKRLDASARVEITRLNTLFWYYNRLIHFNKDIPRMKKVTFLKRRETGMVTAFPCVFLDYPIGLSNAMKIRERQPHVLYGGARLKLGLDCPMLVTDDGMADPVLSAYDRKTLQVERVLPVAAWIP